jgi:hypothetical protein
MVPKLAFAHIPGKFAHCPRRDLSIDFLHAASTPDDVRR